MPGGHLQPRRTGLFVPVVPENLNCQRHTLEGARDYKLLKKKSEKFKMGNYTHDSRKRIATFRKRFQRPPESPVRLTGDSPVQSQALKTERDS